MISLIANKEFRSSLLTPRAYVLAAGTLCLAGYFFFRLLIGYNESLPQIALSPDASPSLNEWVITPYFRTLQFLLVFLVPILTMQSFAEERERGTFELLATSPIKVSQLVWGKFLGVMFVLVTILILTFVFPGSLLLLADPEPLATFIGFFGVLLFALAFAALGLAVSAASPSQGVAAIAGFIVLLMLYVVDAPSVSMGGSVAKALVYASPSNRVELLMKGVIDAGDIIYFLSVIAVGLFASHRFLERERN